MERTSLSAQDLASIEIEIDEAFSESPLTQLPFAQCAWTLLSVAEDHHFKISVLNPLEAPQAAIYADGLMNSLTYPLRAAHRIASKDPRPVVRQLVDDHYQQAVDWIDKAEDYAHFCTIFPLFHAGEIDLKVVGDELIPSDWSKLDLSYEVYDRFVAKRDPDQEPSLNPNLIAGELRSALKVNGGIYSLEFTRQLMSSIQLAFGETFGARHVLPVNWQFSHFTIAQYRSIFVALQGMAYAWFAARQIAASNGALAIAYPSSIWTPKRTALIALLSRHTGLSKGVTERVIRYLTFGEENIRDPDIATQPLVDLANGQIAISPFVMTHVHAERNLCVLLNQVPEDRSIYSRLVDEKEAQTRSEVIDELQALGYEFTHGLLDGTDLDLAIIDRRNKVCLCVELKWFIEPAEVREVLARSKELRKGVEQALKIKGMFEAGDTKLMALLKIDNSYTFQAMVGSVNFIGSQNVQCPDVPILKVWHLCAHVKSLGDLSKVLAWLRERKYLPRCDVDYRISDVEVRSGKWKSRWYGIAYA